MKAIIIDDEKHCREVLETLIKKYCPGVEVAESFANGEVVPTPTFPKK